KGGRRARDAGSALRVRCRGRVAPAVARLSVKTHRNLIMTRDDDRKDSSVTAEPNAKPSYAAAGVDIAAGEQAVELIKPYAAETRRPEVLGGIGGFAGLFQLKLDRWKEPVIASSTDGVGTKIAVAQALDKHDTIGIDLVAMIVDDLVVCGAEPLFLQDYIA